MEQAINTWISQYEDWIATARTCEVMAESKILTDLIKNCYGVDRDTD